VSHRRETSASEPRIEPTLAEGQEQTDVRGRGEAQAQDTGADQNSIAGERGIPSVNRIRSLQSRVSSLLAIGLVCALGLGLLGWYYQRMLARPSQSRESAQAAIKQRSQAEMPLPPLGRIEPPNVEPAGGALEHVLGPQPELPPESAAAWGNAPAMPAHPTAKSAEDLSWERRLAGPVLSPASSPGTYVQSAPQAGAEGGSPAHIYESEAGPERTAAMSELDARLQPAVTSAVRAQRLPTQRLLLPKGAFVDCTLETAIDSTLPGMTTCVMATDSFSADGRVVLLERGTKLVGETQGDVQQGAARVFVVWRQARTPQGVVVSLDSPGTDELGRSGLPGDVNRHFWQRFGAAILVSVIDGALQAAGQSGSGSDTVIVNPGGTQGVMTEVLKHTISIPPTIVKHQGDRIQVLVARDLDFRSVYELRAAGDGA
jgi:type IV secretion system protein VirB10